jgi:hypothetical protein
MFNYEEFEKLKSDLEFYARDYAKAEAGIRMVKEDAIEKVRKKDTAGPEVVEILNEMSRKMDDLDLDKKISKQYFYDTKDKMIAMLENIVLPESYY